VLAAVLKLYFRQLPESVVPPVHSQQLLQIARERHAAGVPIPPERTAAALTAIRLYLETTLPVVNYQTLAHTIVHLRKVADHAAENRMKPSNLGIVFGPTLLGTEADSLTSLMDMPFQSQLVELMIEHVAGIFARFLAQPTSPVVAHANSSRPRRPSISSPLAHTTPLHHHALSHQHHHPGHHPPVSAHHSPLHARPAHPHPAATVQPTHSPRSPYPPRADGSPAAARPLSDSEPWLWPQVPLPQQGGPAVSTPRGGGGSEARAPHNPADRASVDLSDYSDTEDAAGAQPAASGVGHVLEDLDNFASDLDDGDSDDGVHVSAAAAAVAATAAAGEEEVMGWGSEDDGHGAEAGSGHDGSPANAAVPPQGTLRSPPGVNSDETADSSLMDIVLLVMDQNVGDTKI
jgi:hypothetical protein